MNKCKKYASKGISLLLLVLGAVIMLFPFIWSVSASLQSAGKAYQLPPEFFKPPFRFSNYVKVWLEGNMLQYSLNSAFVTVMCIIGSVFADSLAGYGLAKYDCKWTNIVFIVALGTMYIPGNILAVPQYIMWQKLGALNTYIPIIAPKFFGSITGIFLMRQCFKSISNQLYEAATIDGLHPLKIYYKIYLPLVKPMLATLVIQMFMSTWNETFAPLIYITDRSKYTLTVGLLYLRGQYLQNMELLMAASMISVFPLLVVYLLAQKYFVKGMISSGIKG